MIRNKYHSHDRLMAPPPIPDWIYAQKVTKNKHSFFLIKSFLQQSHAHWSFHQSSGQRDFHVR